MGGAFSAPVGSGQTQDILNFILKEMFSRADLVDMYSLADPARCKRFIVVAADALEKLFVKIRLYPQKDRQGILYFQSLDGLTKAQTAAAQEAQAAQRKYCLELAFFFIRIFQTFAALYLTIFDTTLPPTDLPDDVPAPSAVARRATFIDPKSFLGAQVGVKQGFFGTGGALEAPRMGQPPRAGMFYLYNPDTRAPYEYSILNSVLNAPYDATRDIDVNLPFAKFQSISIPQRSLYDFNEREEPDSRVPKRNPTPMILYTFTRMGSSSNTTYTIQGNLKITRSSDTIFTITLSGITSPGGSSKVVPTFTEQLTRTGAGLQYTGRKFPAAVNKGLDALLYEMMKAAEIAIFGEPQLSVVTFLQRFAYLTPYPGKNLLIAGTSVYVLKDQDTLGKVRIMYENSVTLPEEKEKTRVTIPGTLEIEKIQPFPQGGKYSYRVRITFDKDRSTPKAIQDVLYFPENPRAVTFSSPSDSTAPRSEQGDLSIPEFLERRFRNLVTQQADEIEDRSGIKYTRQGFPTPVDSEDIPEDLRVKALWKALAKDPPVKSHCVARATQLLSVAAIRGQVGDTTFSSACRLTFRYQKDGSLPTPGEPITKEHGLLALATLFVESLEAGVPKITDKPRYLEFLKRLRYLFEKFPTLDSVKEVPSRMGDIVERADPTCRSVSDQQFVVSRGLGNDLKSVAQRLMSQQQAHIGAAMRLIFKLFDQDAITRRRVFALNPAVLAGGTPAVNAVAAEARDLLLRYYTDCETTYREGLVKIYQSSLSSPLQAVGAASGVANAAPAAPAPPSRPA